MDIYINYNITKEYCDGLNVTKVELFNKDVLVKEIILEHGCIGKIEVDDHDIEELRIRLKRIDRKSSREIQCIEEVDVDHIKCFLKDDEIEVFLSEPNDEDEELIRCAAEFSLNKEAFPYDTLINLNNLESEYIVLNLSNYYFDKRIFYCNVISDKYEWKLERNISNDKITRNSFRCIFKLIREVFIFAVYGIVLNKIVILPATTFMAGSDRYFLDCTIFTSFSLNALLMLYIVVSVFRGVVPIFKKILFIKEAYPSKKY